MTEDEKYLYLENQLAVLLKQMQLDLPMVTSDGTIAKHAIDSIRLLKATMARRHTEFSKPAFTSSGMNKTKEERNSDR